MLSPHNIFVMKVVIQSFPLAVSHPSPRMVPNKWKVLTFVSVNLQVDCHSS